MTLLKTSFLNGIAVGIKMLVLLIINKVLAVYVGPAGYAAIGQLQNIIQIVLSFSSGAINAGVTKYTAEYGLDSDRQRLIWRNAGMVALIASVFISVLIMIFGKYLSINLLGSAEYTAVFYWFAFTLTFFVFNALFLAVLNGKKETSLYVLSNIAGSILSLLVTYALVVFYGLYGALVALAVYQSLTFLVTLILCYRTDWFRLSLFVGKLDSVTVRKLAKYAVMAITTALCVPVSHMLIRGHLSVEFGQQGAGYWEAIWKLSSSYLMFITTTLSVYYLPRLSELTWGDALKREIISGYKFVIPTVILMTAVIYVFRSQIVILLFSEEFLAISELLAWQLIGDVLKVTSWVLAYVMVGKAMTKLYISTEVIFSASFVLLTYLFSGMYGIKGAVMAHAVNYLIYLFVVLYLIWPKLEGKDDSVSR